MDIEQNPWKSIAVFIIRYFVALTVVLYLVRLGITALVGVKTGVFKFEFYSDFSHSLKDGVFFGIIFGIGEWAMRRAKKFEEEKRKKKDE